MVFVVAYHSKLLRNKKGLTLVPLDTLDDLDCRLHITHGSRRIRSSLWPLAHAVRIEMPVQPKDWLARDHYVLGPHWMGHVHDKKAAMI